MHHIRWQQLHMKAKFNIAMIGGRGYVGQEIIQILNDHPNFGLVKIFSKSSAGDPVNEYKKSKLNYSLLEVSDINLEEVDIVIMALPNNESFKYLDIINQNYSDITLIDLSSDYRFDKDWQYRIPEITREKATNRISNPGCYATAMQLSISPLKDLIKDSVSCMGISGYSGAGASPNDKNNPDNLKNNIIPYSLSNHIHENEVQKHCYEDLLFSPHVGNFFRGILITSHIKLKNSSNESEIYRVFSDYYKNDPLVKIQKDIPMINKVINKHSALIGGFSLDKSGCNITICCVIDNLLKGAATQAIQNLNSSCDLEELTGINND